MGRKVLKLFRGKLIPNGCFSYLVEVEEVLFSFCSMAYILSVKSESKFNKLQDQLQQLTLQFFIIWVDLKIVPD